MIHHQPLLLGSSLMLMLLPAAAFLTPPPPHLHVQDRAVMAGGSYSSFLHAPTMLFTKAKKGKATVDEDSSSSSNATTTTTTTASSGSAWEDLSEAAQDVWENIRDAPERYKLKQDIILQGASYDRGFGASPSARQKVKDMVDELVTMNPTTSDDATLNIEGKHDDNNDVQEAPLKGNWRLVWTTAQDILALNASPFTVVGAIHQVVEPPVVTNIVDFIPRAQELVAPDKIRSTLFRGKVMKKAAAKSETTLDLTFESFNVKAVEVLGRKTGAALPAWAVNIPKLPGTPDNGSLRQQQVEIAYLDDTMLITKQKAPGGTNVFVKVPDAEV